MATVKKRPAGTTRISSKHQVTIPQGAFEAAGLVVGEAIGARRARPAPRRVGLTVVDAGVVIAHLDPADAHHAAASDALREAFEAYDELVVPAAALAEERATRLLTTDRGWPEPASLDLPGVLVVV